MRTTATRRFAWMSGWVLLCLGGILTGTLAGQQGTATVPADLVAYPQLVVYNGKIVTMDDYDINTSVGTTVEAMAIRDGKVWKRGSSKEMLAYAGPETKRLDVKGRTIVPGIINVHTHIHDHVLGDWAEENSAALTSLVRSFRVEGKTTDEIGKNLRVMMTERMKGAKPGQWAFFYLPTPPAGSGIGPGNEFVTKRKITAQEIDRLLPKNPVIVASHPVYIINTAAKEEMGKIYSAQPGHDGWEEDGFTYQGVDFRRQLVVEKHFESKTAELAEILREGLLTNAAAGITTFSSHIMALKHMDAYMRLYRENRMPIRFGFTHYTGFVLNKDQVGFYRRLGDMAGLGNDYFWFAAVGASYIDSGPPGICSGVFPKEERKLYRYCRISPGTSFYEALVTVLQYGGRVVAGHNYGDESADQYMDILEEAMRRNPEITLEHIRSLRLSMDHGGLYPRPDQLPRLKNLGMMLSMEGPSPRSIQLIDMFGFEKYQHWLSPLKSALEAGIKVAYEGEGGYKNGMFSEFTSLITREHQGRVVAPHEAVDRNTVMKMATAWGSEFVRKEKVLGSLEPGKYADFLVLNHDYFTVPVEQIGRTYPVMTVVGGDVVFLHDTFAPDLGMAPVGNQIRYPWE